MSHDVLAIAGSPRRGGNSETLLDRALETVRALEPGRVEKLVLNELDIRPCQNCGYCERAGRCRFADSDEMKRIYPMLEDFDRFIVASPVFFGNVPAQLKGMIDRCQPYWVKKFIRGETHPQAGRRRALLLSVGGFEHDRFHKCVRQVIKTWCICLDIDLSGDLFCAGIDERGAIARHPTALAETAEAARELMTE